VLSDSSRITLARWYRLPLDNGDIEIGRIFYGGRDYEAIRRDEAEETLWFILSQVGVKSPLFQISDNGEPYT